MSSEMDTYNKDKNEATESKNNISKKEVFFKVNHYSIRTDIIEKSQTRKYKYRIQKKYTLGSVINKRSTNRHKKCEKIEKCRECKKIFRYTEMKFCTFQRVSKETVLESEKRIVHTFILDFIHKFI